VTALALAVAALLAQAEELPPRREVPAEVQRVPTVQLVGPLRAPVPDVRVVEEGAGSGPAPTDFVLLGYRVHVFVSEDLEPDALRRLVRPGVTLWLQTRSNMLRASTVDTLRRAEVAWVQLRPPVLRPHWDQLGKLPRAGVWVQPQHVHGPGMGRRGSHPLALDVRAPVTGESLAQVRPLSTVFRVPVSAAVAQRVPGERLLWGGLAGGCSADPLLKVRMDAPWRPPCGHGVLAQLTRVQLSELQGLYAAHPGVELAVEVADSEAAASGVAALLDVLDAAAARQAAGP
jgi:hypothetical protein